MSEPKSEYAKKLRDPRWQKMRLQILERDQWTCQGCFDTETTLHVHHRWYERGKDPWEYEPAALLTLCETCHQDETELRQEQERLLLYALKRHFLHGHLNELAHAFLRFKPTHMTDYVATAIAFVIQNEAGQRAVVDLYAKAIGPDGTKTP
jgi:hypothetical protein